ncbi:alpha-ketoacid dehydrogenase subunit beta, partial [Candidatus Margulisiibacteriota bacterium]
AITEATDQAMQLDPNVMVIGQGTRDRGCIFGSVDGLFEKYGEERIVEMPLSENAIAGICVGAAIEGLRPVFILQRVDFLFLALDQLINHASKYHFMFGGKIKVPVTFRLIVGKGWGQGSQHSQSLHSLLSHFPGIRVALPSTPKDVKGILLNSVFSDDPTVVFEGRPLFSHMAEVPEKPYLIPFGEAKVVRKGKDLTIVAVSFMVAEALRAAGELAKMGISAEVVDLISASPLDLATIVKSVKKTRRLLIADISWDRCGISSEISSQVNKALFKQLKAPIETVNVQFAPAPTGHLLEKAFYPGYKDIIKKCI